LFAPDDDALRLPKRRRRPKHLDDADIQMVQDEIAANPEDPEIFALLEGLVLDHEQIDDDDEKKEWIKKLVRAVLLYHILPEVSAGEDLARNATFATSLSPTDGSLGGKPSRLRVLSVPGLLKPTYTVNFYARVTVSDIKATNGIVHAINHPLLPPPSIFQILFLFPEGTSTFTTALQRVGLDIATDWSYVPNKGTFEGSPSNSVFAPSNKAFNKLPHKLKLFLFSPFGHRVLKKLLQFHIVPEYIFHTDWTHNATVSFVPPMEHDCQSFADPYDMYDYSMFTPEIFESAIPHHGEGHVARNEKRGKRCNMRKKGLQFDAPRIPHPPLPDPIFSVNTTLPTLLTNHSLPVHVAQFEHRSPIPPHKSSYVTLLFVNGDHKPVHLTDIPARNGALHVIEHLLNPVKHHKKHHKKDGGGDDVDDEKGEWDGWEDWLLEWADQN